MSPEVEARPSPIARSLHLALLFLGLGSGILGSAVLAIAVGPSGVGETWLYTMVFCAYLLAGITAWWRRPGNRIGAIILGGALGILGAGLSTATQPILVALGSVVATLVLAVLIHLLHAFPSGQVRGTTAAMIVIAAYANSILLQAPSYLFVPDAANPLFITALPLLVEVADIAQQIVGVCVTVATAIVLVLRLRAADSTHRRVLAPLFAYGFFAVLFIPFSAGVLEGMFGLSSWARGVLQLAVLGGVPIAFTLGMLLGGFSRASGLGTLDTWISATERSTVVAALARTVGDPDLDVVYWVEERGVHVDAEGAICPLPVAGDRRAAVDVEIDGRRVGAIVYDSGLIADDEPVRDAGRLAAIVLDRQRLTAELHASERALAESRAKIERADAAMAGTESGIAHLTARQREVLALIAQGRSNAAIARELMVTEKSVVNHTSRIYDALDLPVESDDHRRVRATIRYLAG